MLDCVHQDGQAIKMSRHIELLLSRRETFPISPSSGGCINSEKGIRETTLTLFIDGGEQGGWGEGAGDTDAVAGIYSSLIVLIKY